VTSTFSSKLENAAIHGIDALLRLRCQRILDVPCHLLGLGKKPVAVCKRPVTECKFPVLNRHMHPTTFADHRQDAFELRQRMEPLSYEPQ
jgi:hypothetical protein